MSAELLPVLERIAAALETLAEKAILTRTGDTPNDLPRPRTFDEPPITEALRQYLNTKAHEVSQAHYTNMSSQIVGFAASLPAPLTHLSDLQPSHVVAYRDSLLARGRGKNTANAHVGAVGALLRWAGTMGWVDRNVAEGLKLRQRKARQEERAAFSTEEIGRIFCAQDYARATRGRPAHYWLPLIMLYTGARPEEVAQLRRKDVVRGFGEAGPAWDYFDFETMEEGQKRKNTASRRRVPIHSKLIGLGLYNYLENGLSISTLGGGGGYREFLFPQLNPGHSNRLAVAPSRWFNEKWLRDTLKIRDKRKVLYSLRHTVATLLGVTHKIEEARIAQLLGHTHPTMTMGRYGKAYDLEGMREVVEMLEFPVGVERWGG